MKTIDLLVQALPAIGGWPEKVTHIGQDYDRELMFYGRGNVRSGIFLDQLAADHRKHGKSGTKITREQYEAALAEKEHPLPWDEKNKPCPTLGAECRGCADCGRRFSCTSDDITDDAVRTEMGMNSRALDAALAAKNDDWIEWGGGECPVERGVLVEVKYRNEKNYHIKGVNRAWEWSWEHHGTEGDIIAYRLHQPQEAEQAKADDEADLNECIGQDAAPVWSGEGLPPVGCECEVSVDGGRSWCTYRAINEKNGARLIEIGNFTEEFQNNNWIFRPIRSEAERKRDAAAQALCDAGGGSGEVDEKEGYGSCWFDVYDAIAAGEIPGVKLED